MLQGRNAPYLHAFLTKGRVQEVNRRGIKFSVQRTETGATVLQSALLHILQTISMNNTSFDE